ncbi:Flagellin protein FlaG [Marinobacter nitratireducens]|uniref:Flagellin protein FlaG n=1 Tax=Marinobacter nitratireducens TaxID=1137280 RepID=A0A072NF27_9GAMM|nr:flagellar protein FlaG [Marinobacter nitratireducens]KEF31685.1 Flagellin protein FlaG [Marinobacter nitratireducens]
MNDVNLNTPDLKLVRSGAQAPAKAMSSSQAEGRNASDPAASGRPVQPPKEVNESAVAEQRQAVSGAEKGDLEGAVSQLNDFVQAVHRDLQFEVDNELGQTVVKVVDQETQEVIRQMPDEVALRLAEKLQQDEPLTLFNIEV